MNIEKLKKAEIHLHLDGSLRTQTVFDLAKEDGIELPADTSLDLEKYLRVDGEIKSLIDYLSKFDLPLKVLQTKKGLKRIAFELAEDLAKENYIYVEIRFAPHLHLLKGLNINEVIEAVLEGIKEAEAKYDIKARVILCVMRHLPVERGFDIVQAAEMFKLKGVVGIDLAGDEKNYPPELFKSVFAKAQERGINFTIHAGEAAGPQSVKGALELGATRIGHGVRSIEDKEVIEELIKKGIVLEVCPISNQQTKVYETIDEYPIVKLINAGLKISLNTDNRTVSWTTLANEIQFLMEKFNLTEDIFKKMIRNTIEAAFISEKEKTELLEKL